MIFYFSGTGNSLYVAKNIGGHNNENLVSVAKKMIINFIEKLKLNNYKNNYKNNYIFTVATCGENIGNTIKVLDNCLKKKNLYLKSGFSIAMPNNYVILGNVDTKDVENTKLLAAEESLVNINKIIKDRREGVYKVEKGPVPEILTAIVNPLFSKMNMSTKKFYADDKCISCGLCESVCNSKTITVNGKPSWGKACTQCLACVHLCPVKAIQYGKGTESKGRYKNPNIDVNEMKYNKRLAKICVD